MKVLILEEIRYVVCKCFVNERFAVSIKKMKIIEKGGSNKPPILVYRLYRSIIVFRNCSVIENSKVYLSVV